MTPAFAVLASSHYERLAKKLMRSHRDFAEVQANAGAILGVDPYNASRQRHIKKLEGVAAGDGQFRLTMGRWRFRYDIAGREARLTYCGLRREDTYRRT
jgi:hypothetical protein